MDANPLANKIIERINQTGLLKPVWMALKNGSSFRRIIVGMNIRNNRTTVEVLDPETSRSEGIPLNDIMGFTEEEDIK